MKEHKTHRRLRKSSNPPGFIIQYRLSGRTLPKRTNALRLGKLFRHTFFRHLSDTFRPAIPHSIQKIVRSAFFLHEDRDQDGFIEYIILYFHRTPPTTIKPCIHTFPKSHLFKKQGWSVTLEHEGPVKDIKNSLIFGFGSAWNSYTPFFPGNRDCQPRDILRAVSEECKRSGLPNIAGYDVVRGGIILQNLYNRIELNKFYSPFRSRYTHYPYGASIQICFEKAIHGPLLLGYGRHIGAGMFYETHELTLGTRWDLESYYGLGLG